jgi:hypothetical protein
MPFQKRLEGGYSKNTQKDNLGNKQTVDVSLIKSSVALPETNVNELIIEFTTGENVTAQNAGCVISGLLYNASNLKSIDRPVEGIILNTVAIGGKARLQIAGYCNMSFGFTANKKVYLRYGTANISQTPLITPTVVEDGFQIIGKALNPNILLISIEPFAQII